MFWGESRHSLDSKKRVFLPKRFQKVLARNEEGQLGVVLTRGFEGNVVVEMGAALHRMARLLPEADRADPVRLAARLAEGDLPGPFLDAWQEFLATYGWRGPHEVDLGSPRYADAPVLALRQLCAMDLSTFDPDAVHARHRRERGEAQGELMRRVGPLRRRTCSPRGANAVASS